MADYEDDDLFADLYDGDDAANAESATIQPLAPAAVEPVSAAPAQQPTEPAQLPSTDAVATQPLSHEEHAPQEQSHHGFSVPPTAENGLFQEHAGIPNAAADTDDRPLQMKEDGKMFIGGLNWETTDQSMRNYFSQFGEVIECTVMRDQATGRSRGFGFLTFKEPKCVNMVMVKEHQLDGKLIDPKRAIPRDEQERTSKIFVGGVSQEATESDFKEFFMQFGRVLDATLMMDKETLRPRGFGFVTFDSEAAVDRCLQQPLAILGKPIEVKKAQPRGNLDNDNGSRNKFQNNRNFNQGGAAAFNGGGGGVGDGGQAPMTGPGGAQMTPNMMAQYWTRMQQFMMMQQQMMMGGGMQQQNPAMMQQMMAMQQRMREGGGGGEMSPGGGQAMSPVGADGEQGQQASSQQGSGSPGGWDMYDDMSQVPQGPGGYHQQRGGYRGGRGGGGGYQQGFNRQQQQQQPAQAPAGAPTGPKNMSRPGGSYRGGRGGGHRGYHPYANRG